MLITFPDLYPFPTPQQSPNKPLTPRFHYPAPYQSDSGDTDYHSAPGGAGAIAGLYHPKQENPYNLGPADPSAPEDPGDDDGENGDERGDGDDGGDGGD